MAIPAYKLSGLVVAFSFLVPVPTALAQQTPSLQINSFSVGPDETPTYPNDPTVPNHLVALPDEHTTIIPPAPGENSYLVFAASLVSGAGATWGAVVLQTTDLQNFGFATALGYNRQVMAPPLVFGQCNPAYDTEFDETYASPGSVLQDPTLPAGNLIMLYEAENHCPGGVNQFPFYVTVGFARSSDNGKTWPAPANGVLGGPGRHPILQSSEPPPAVAHPYMGDGIPSALVDKDANGDSYLYVTYTYYAAVPTSGNVIRVARAKLGQDPLNFLKWYNGSFSQPGIGGLDSGVLPSTGCGNGYQAHSEINYNDDLGLYLMLYVCVSGPKGAQVGAWYYSTATSLDLQDWAAPRMILNSQFPVTTPCSANGGQQFDGWYPSSMSPGAAAGHTKLTGHVFFLNGCNLGARQFMSRTFTISASQAPPVISLSVSQLSFSYSGGAVPNPQRVTVSNSGAGTISWTASSDSPWLLISPTSGTTPAALSISVKPAGLASGNYRGVATVSSPGITSQTIMVTLSVTAPTPAISAAGIVGGGLSVPTVQQISANGLISIFGQNFAPAGTLRGVTGTDLVNGNLPTNLGGVCVQIGSLAAPMFFVSPTQINVQVPTLSTASGTVPVQVMTNCGTSSQSVSNTQSVTVQAAAPEFFFFQHTSSGANPVAVTDALTGALLGDPAMLGSGFTPANPDGYVTFYVTGLGTVTPAVQAGTLPSGIANTTSPATVRLNGVALSASDVLYAGVAPGFAGLYQVNIHLPATTPNGNIPVTIQVGGFSTPAGGFITVGK